MPKIYSPISIDMGGVNTGVFSSTYKENFLEKDAKINTATIIYDKNFIISQVNRRVKRHQKRNKLRRKLAKRLFLLITKQHFKIDIDFLPDNVLGLFNRRGYTYLDKEIERDKIENDEFLKFAENYFNKTDFLEYFDSIIEPTKEFEEKVNLLNNSKDYKGKIKSGINELKKFVDFYHKQKDDGNYKREDYFDNIKEHIKSNNELLNFISQYKLSVDEFVNIIGNISNYQLKELRRYFNDIEMKKEDIWLPQKLHNITRRFIESWHPKKDEDIKNRRLRVLKKLKNEDIIKFLISTNPIETIPPYNDMNNRGMVKCQSLRLNAEYLDANYPEWRNILNELIIPDVFTEDLDKSTPRGFDKDAVILQRILETTKSIDKYKLREVLSHKTYKQRDGYRTLVAEIGELNAEKFIKLAKEFYTLVDNEVRTGLWSDANGLLKKCNHNPPYKSNQTHNLLAQILGVNISKEKYEDFINNCYTSKVGNTTLKGFCKSVEELRKQHGNTFKTTIEETIYKEKLNKKDLSKEHKDILKQLKKLNGFVDLIANFFEIKEEYKSRFNNLFSMAQIHTIIEKHSGGFNKTCKWCSIENRWRSKTSETLNKSVANAQRLPADTQRPFSGKIEKYIDKLAYEIVKIKKEEIKNIDDNEIFIPIILEQNRFEYEESLLKNKIIGDGSNKKALKENNTQKENFNNRLKSREERIKSFNKYCPYTGEVIGENSFELDHIIPRSYSLKNYGAIFNSEMNLIHSSQRGNQQKKENIYTLSNLSKSYKKEIFGDKNDDEIIEWIEKTVDSINNYKSYILLNSDQQKAVKNALFLPHNNETFKKVLWWLQQNQSTRVNGTQKYLAKKIMEKLKKEFKDSNKKLSFEFNLINANDISEQRNILSKTYTEYKKQEKQSTTSHIIDAFFAYLLIHYKYINNFEEFDINIVDLKKVIKKNDIIMKSKSTNSKIEKIITGESNNFKPIFKKPIFKENAIKENFKPFIKIDNKWYIGYPKRFKNKKISIVYCKELSKKDSKQIEKIIEEKNYIKKIIKLNDNSFLYQINKKNVIKDISLILSELQPNLSDETKIKLNQLEFIINNSRYYTSKKDVIFAPQILAKKETIQYPFYNTWKSFDLGWKKIVGDKYNHNNKEYKINDENRKLWNSYCKDFFKNTNNKQNNRKKAKKVFTIQALTSPPGTVFRIKRKGIKKDVVFQAFAIDTNQIKGEYAPILLKNNNNKTLSLANNKASKIINKKMKIVEEFEIYDKEIESKLFFNENANFDYSDIKVILNKTKITIQNFPIKIMKERLLILPEKFEENMLNKTIIPFSKNESEFGVDKNIINKITNVSVRDDQNITNVELNDDLINFTLPYKSEQIQNFFQKIQDTKNE